MTVQELIDAIAEALFQEFGSEYEINTERVEQGLTEPCFFVRCLNLTRNLHLGRRYKRTNQFSIQYIPSNGINPADPYNASNVGAVEECIGVLERLFVCLGSISVSGRIFHGSEVSGEIVDGVLTFMINYDGFVLREYEEATMEDLEVLIEPKG